MEASPLRHAFAELAATLAALAALSLWLQLRDETSPLRLKLAEWKDRVSEWSIRYRTEALIESVEGGSEP
jgi:hypothetical protein